MLTKQKLFFWWPYHKIQICSEGILFYIKYLGFSKMDKNKCPKTKIQKKFTQKYSLLYNKLKYLLKEKSTFGKENPITIWVKSTHKLVAKLYFLIYYHVIRDVSTNNLSFLLHFTQIILTLKVCLILLLFDAFRFVQL